MEATNSFQPAAMFRSAIALAVSITFTACTVDPVKTTPTTQPNGAIQCSLPSFGGTSLAALGPAHSALTQSIMSSNAPLIADQVSGFLVNASQVHARQWSEFVTKVRQRASDDEYDQRLPIYLHNRAAIYSMARLLSYQSLVTAKAIIRSTKPSDFQVVESIANGGTHFAMSAADTVDHAQLRLLIANPLFLSSTDATAVQKSIEEGLKATKPSSISTGDFKDLYAALVSVHNESEVTGEATGSTANAWHRIVQYESYYFNGKFIDRFGTLLQKPSLSLTVSDQEIGGALTALLEAIADQLDAELFSLPVWATDTPYTYVNTTGGVLSAVQMASKLQGVIAAHPPAGITPGAVSGSSFELTAAVGAGFESGAEGSAPLGGGTIDDQVTRAMDDGSGGGTKQAQQDTITLTGTFAPQESVTEHIYGSKYYPGASTSEPSVLVYSESAKVPRFTMLQPLVTDGCGMTVVKADALNYISGKAATWASGESGLVLGLMGGPNAGPVLVLWKFSIGDNKTLQTIVQTVLAEAAKRATYQVALPLMWAINQPKNATVPNLLDQLIFKSQ